MTSSEREGLRTDEARAPAPRWRAWLAIGAVAAAVVLFQIAVTRVLSVTLWYHWAFLAVSMAMLGLAVPGIWFSFFPPSRRALCHCLLGGAASLPLAVLGILHHATWLAGNQSVLLCMAMILLPMLLLGGAVCALLLAAPGDAVGRMYGADLTGAGLAAVVVVPLLWVVPTPQLIVLLGLLPLLALLLLEPRRAWQACLGAAVLVALCSLSAPFQLRYTKNYDESRHELLYERWTPTARLAFFDRPLWVSGNTDFGWGAGTKAPPHTVEQRWMEQDGCAGTPITRFDGDVSSVRHLLFDVTSFAYQLRQAARVCVIGAGGGRDVLSALCAGASHVDAVELNGGVIETVGGRFDEFSGGLYHRDDVTVAVDEGRSFLTRSEGGYDAIQISLIDSWAATAAGAFSLAENNLYTVQAYRLCWQRLSEHGLVTTSRWLHNFESLRLLNIHLEALRLEGVERPQEHLMVAVAGSIVTVVCSRAPIAALLPRAKEVCEERGFVLVYPAGLVDPNLAGLLEGGGLQVEPLDLSPSTDDRPFFFQTLSPMRWVDDETSKKLDVNAQAVRALQLLIVVVAGLTLLLCFLPFALRRPSLKGAGFWRGSAYFAAIGTGFMLIEMPWLQRFVLFLGHPSHAAATVLGALLAGSGLGAMCTGRLGLPRLCSLAVGVPLMLALVHLGTPTVFAETLGATLPVRILIAVALLLPTGFLLGLMFPAGMLRFGDGSKAWFWAVNGACSVFASVASLLLAMQFGFTAVGLVGIGCYVAAAVLLRGRRVGG